MHEAKRRQYKTSKFIREYGMTLVQIAKKYNMSTSYIRILHLQDELHDKEQESKREKVGAK